MTRSSDDPLISLGIDPGAGAVKIYGPAGGVQLPSLVATDGGRTLSRMAGLAQAKPPLHVSTRAGNFWLGSRAPDWGRLVENLDHERFTGSPEMQALLLGSLTTYIGQYGPLTEPLEVTVGLPLEALTGSDEETQVTGSSVRRWLIGEHVWSADNQPYRVVVGEVKVSSQPAGALFDFLLDEAGSFIPARKLLFGKEIGVISVGLSTVELLAVRNGAPINRFTMGQTSGVRRLLELAAPDGVYTIGELDTLLRTGKLDISLALPIWAREVTGLIERRWGRDVRRFTVVVVVGGGALLLREVLLARFGGKAYVPDDPVLATARGLFKMTRMQTRRKRTGQAGTNAAGGGADES